MPENRRRDNYIMARRGLQDRIGGPIYRQQAPATQLAPVNGPVGDQPEHLKKQYGRKVA